MSVLLYIEFLQKLQKYFSTFLLKVVLFLKIFQNKKKLKEIHCYTDKNHIEWLQFVEQKTNYKIRKYILHDASFQSIHRYIINNKVLPKYILILFPEITCVETYDDTSNNYIPIYLPQLRKKNIDFFENAIFNKNFFEKYVRFLYHFTPETLINESICLTKQIQQFCKIHRIKLNFILPGFFFSKLDQHTLEKIFDSKLFMYKEKNINYEKIGKDLLSVL